MIARNVKRVKRKNPQRKLFAVNNTSNIIFFSTHIRVRGAERFFFSSPFSVLCIVFVEVYVRTRRTA